MKELTLCSLFDGSGGFPLAASMCGITPVACSEVEPYPIAVTRSRFPNMIHLGDVSKVHGYDLTPVDVVTFGSPCQSLSVAGKREGLRHTDMGDDETTRSGLFIEAIRIITEMREATDGMYPTFAVWENAPGAFSSSGGADFQTVLEKLAQIKDPNISIPQPDRWLTAGEIVGDGFSIAWRTVDAQYFGKSVRDRDSGDVLVRGTPQRRRRIYLVADFAGQRAGKILFERESMRGYPQSGGTPRQATASLAERCAGADDRAGESACAVGFTDGVIPKEQHLFENHSQDTRFKGPLDVSPMLPAQLGTGGNNTPFVVEQTPFCKSSRPKFKGDSPTYIPCKATNTLNTFDVGEARANELVVATAPAYCLQGSMVGRADKNGPQGNGVNEEVAFTCNTTDRHAVAFTDESSYIVRRLTPTECARLQGFPDTWGHPDVKTELTDEEYAFWLGVRNTHASINSKPQKTYTREQMLKWYNNLHTDSAEYKMWGNGIALPCAVFVMQGIAEELKKQN